MKAKQLKRLFRRFSGNARKATIATAMGGAVIFAGVNAGDGTDMNVSSEMTSEASIVSEVSEVETETSEVISEDVETPVSEEDADVVSEIEEADVIEDTTKQDVKTTSGTVKEATEYIPGFNDVMNDVLWDNRPTNDTEMLELLSQGEDYSNIEIIDYDGYDYNNIQAGKYTITLSDTTETYLDTPVDFKLASEVVNTVAPTITGANNVSVNFGSTFDNMLGVSATDEQGNDITNLITVTGDTVNTSVSGDYTLTYSVTDPTNSSLVTTIDRIVTVKPDPTADNTKPVINGVSDKTVQWGASFDSMTGVSATDDVDGDVDVTVSGTVDTKVSGAKANKVYTLTYTAKDSAGNTATEDRDITVLYYSDHTNSDGVKYRNYYNKSTMYARRYYHSNGETKQLNFYNESTGNLENVTYRNTSGTKTGYKTYYSNGKLHLYYNYYSNGKTSKRQEYNSNGTRARITEYNSYGYYKMIETYNSQGYKTSHKAYVFGNQSKESSRQKTHDYTYYSNNNRIHTRTTWNSSGKKTTYYEKYNQSNGQYKSYYNYFSNGKVSKRQTWSSNGHKTDHHEYYSNGKVSKNYDYYSSGRISYRYTYRNDSKHTLATKYRRYNQSGGQYAWSNHYFSNGKMSSHKTWATDGDTTDYKEYYSNGKTSKNYDYYSNGTISKRYTYNSKGHRTTYYVRYQGTKTSSGHKSGQYKEYRNYDGHGHWTKYQTWSSNGHRTDYRTYYSNHKKSADYSYYSNGKVKAKYLYYSNGHYKQRRWYYSNGDLKEVRYYNSKGHRTSTKTYKQSSSSNTSSSSKTIGNMNTYETQVFNEINSWRKAHGYSTLKHSNQVHGYAETEVKASSANNTHPWVFATSARKSWDSYSAIQAYCGSSKTTSCSAKSYVNSWANSSGHRKIMSDNWEYMSVAYDNNDIQVIFTRDAK